ncbi:hypothetical protein [Streptomyces sp. NBC_01497]|nr:hypothetical protein [Streptomyces sp. NBC_01497]
MGGDDEWAARKSTMDATNSGAAIAIACFPAPGPESRTAAPR